MYHTALYCLCGQDFLLKSEAAFKSHPVWASSPGEHQQQAIEVRSSRAGCTSRCLMHGSHSALHTLC
jgi:hypothetical protein